MSDGQLHEKIIAIRQRKAEAEQRAIRAEELRQKKITQQVQQVRGDKHFAKLNARSAGTEKRIQTLALARGYKEAKLLIEKHKETLLLKYRQCFRTDDYGQIILVNENGWRSEIDYFVNRVMGNSIESSVFLKLDQQKLISAVDLAVKAEYGSVSLPKKISIDMSGVEFERHCAEILDGCGWKTTLTKGSGDQGIDILATKNKVVVVIQCKRLSKPVGNQAVQQAFSGMQFIKAHYSAVVTTATFTPKAREIARETGTFLLTDNDLLLLDALIKQRSLIS